MGSPQENIGDGSGSGPRLQNPFRDDEDALNEVEGGPASNAIGSMRRGNSDGNMPPRGHPGSHSGVPEHNGETWMDFLRHPQDDGRDATGRERALARRAAMLNADRMRRLQDRSNAQGRTRSATANPQLGGDRDAPQNPLHLSPMNPFNNQRPRPQSFLTGDQSTPMLPPPISSPPRRQTGEIVLPRWQPDAEVSECPICHKTFSLFFRKHHCRKCGRVVCGSCSPHRITIPRQFIVHPPQEQASDLVNAGVSATDAIDLTSDGEVATATSATNPPPGGPLFPGLDPALGGGQEVRLCNPCVPDPNPSPPPYTPTNLQALNPFPTVSTNPTPRAQFEALPPHLYRPPNPRPPAPPPHTPSYRRQTLPSGPALQNPTTAGNRPSQNWPERRSSGGPLRSSGEYQRNPFSVPYPPARPLMNLNQPLPPRPTQNLPPHLGGSAPDPTSMHYGHYVASLQRAQQQHLQQILHSHHRASASTSQLPERGTERGPRSMLDVGAPLPPTPMLREEDECPICHLALPEGSESVREGHVKQCIEDHFSSSGPKPSARVAVEAAVATTSATPGQASGVGAGNGHTGAGAAAEPRPRAESSTARARRPAGMLVYHASEKDCVAQDGGDAQECVICFEEFQVGVEMGRLECLCKFHRECIRQWWNTKGVGACPVHQGGLN